MENNSGNKVSKHDFMLRVASIDILRALTMVLMIFVNDLGSLNNIPGWLEHVERGVDGIGLADVVFPAFLFIVGISIPFAIANRMKKGDTKWRLIKHILLRTIALLVMGVFLVNGETYNAEATGMARYLWNPLCCLSFILIWNAYPVNKLKILSYILRSIGIIILIVLAIIYRGGTTGEEIYRFSPQWWGILGIIGWAYLVSALILIFAGNRFIPLFIGWLFFCVLSILTHAHIISREALSFVPDAITGGTYVALTMGGVVTSYVFRYYRNQGDNKKMTIIFIISTLLLIVLSVLTRPYWGLAKIGSTPAWLFLCSAFTLGTFLIIYWIADVKGKSGWFNFIRPAGTDTLLCYLMPYFVGFILRHILHLHLPDFILTGIAGLMKSLLIAILCVGLTYTLNKAGVRLKL